MEHVNCEGREVDVINLAAMVTSVAVGELLTYQQLSDLIQEINASSSGCGGHITTVLPVLEAAGRLRVHRAERAVDWKRAYSSEVDRYEILPGRVEQQVGNDHSLAEARLSGYEQGFEEARQLGLVAVKAQEEGFLAQIRELSAMVEDARDTVQAALDDAAGREQFLADELVKTTRVLTAVLTTALDLD